MVLITGLLGTFALGESPPLRLGCLEKLLDVCNGGIVWDVVDPPCKLTGSAYLGGGSFLGALRLFG